MATDSRLVFARFIFKDESNLNVRVEGRGERRGVGGAR